MTSEPANVYEPRHGHEREQGIPPFFDTEGRCLICGLELRLDHALGSERRAVALWEAEKAKVARLRKAILWFLSEDFRSPARTRAILHEALAETAEPPA